MENRIKVLSKQILDMGGELPSDKDLEKLALKIQAQERQKDVITKQLIDLGNEDLNDIELNDEVLPERRLTEMGKQMEEEEKNAEELS